MEKLGLNLGYLLFHTFNFLIITILLYAFAYRPILKALENRRQKIAQGLEDAQTAAAERARAEQEAARILNEAQANAARLVREATERAEQAAEEIRRAAEAEARQIRQEAQKAAEEERNRLLAELRGQVTTIAIAAAQKLLGEALDEQRQRALLNAFFSGIKDGKVAVLEEVAIGSDAVEVVSALPLTGEEQSTIQRSLQDRLGAAVPIHFRVDPAILGGLLIRSGSKVLDASLAGQLTDLRQTLQEQ